MNKIVLRRGPRKNLPALLEGELIFLSDAKRLIINSQEEHVEIPSISTLMTGRVLVSDSTGAITSSAVTSTELGYLGGVTSSIQTQINSKASKAIATTSVDGLLSAEDKTKLDRMKEEYVQLTNLTKLTEQNLTLETLNPGNYYALRKVANTFADKPEGVTLAQSYVTVYWDFWTTGNTTKRIELINCGDGRKWYKSYDGTKWGNWIEYTRNVNGSPVDENGVSVDRIAKPIYLGDQDTIDFDTITSPGIYYSNTSTSLEDGAILNFPDYSIPRSGRGFVLTMYLAQGSMTQVLRLVSPAYPYTYERRYRWWSGGDDDPAGWGAWTKVVSSDIAGNISVKGYNRIDLTNTTTDVDTLNLNTGIPQQAFYYCRTSGGAANISNIPVVGQPFLLDVKVIRYSSTKDFITLQEFISGTDLIGNREFKYYRYCRNGAWSDWLQEKIIPSNNEIPVYDSWADLGLTLSSTSPATFIVDAINKMATPSIGRFLVNRNPSDIFPDTYGICTIYKAATTLSTLEFVRPFVSGTDSRSASYVATYRPDYPGIVWYETTVPRTVAANRVLISDASRQIASSAVTSTELGYLDGVTSAIQTQLNNRVTTNTTQTITGVKTFTGKITAPSIGSSSGNHLTISSGAGKNISFMGASQITLSSGMILNANDINIDGDILPITSNTASIGSSDLKLKNVYATTFTGSLSGNATSATKATQDGNGRVISSTYALKSETAKITAGTSAPSGGSNGDVYIQYIDNSRSNV